MTGESGEFVRGWARIRSEIVKPVLEEAAKGFKSSHANADARVVDQLPGSAICLELKRDGERRQLTFSGNVTPLKVSVSHTDARDEQLLMGKPLSLTEVTRNRVQSYVDDFLDAVTPK